MWFETKATWLHTHKKASPVLERLRLEKSKEKQVPYQFDIACQLFKMEAKTSLPPSDSLQTPKFIRKTLLIPKGHKVCTTQN